MIVILDYGMGNVGSIRNMLRKIGVESIISGDLDTIHNASKLILPGVGSFDTGMRNLKEHGLFDILNEQVIEKKIPILGICLGMQLMTCGSEEGNLPGLSWFDAYTKKFRFSSESDLRVPHMGWNHVQIMNQSTLFKELEETSRFYFVHSYYVETNDDKDVLGKTNYGIQFTSSMHKSNIYGVQFHPEKSHKYGMALLKNFSEV